MARKGGGQGGDCAIADRPLLIIRGRPWDDTDKYMRQGDDIEHPDSAPDRRLAVLERIPGKAGARREVFQRRVLVVGIAGSDRRVGNVAKIGNLPIYFLDHGGHVIPHTEIDGEIRTDAVVVLNVSSEDRVSQAADSIRAGELRAELSWLDLQHGGDGGKSPKPVGAIAFIQVVQNAFKREAGADAMPASGPGQIVIKLRCRVKEFV